MTSASPVSPLKLLATALYLATFPVALLLLGGDWRWREGWIFGGWFLGLCISTIAWLYRNDPALLAERYRRPGSGGQSWSDQAIVYLLAIGFIAWIALMPLDAHRWRWTPRMPLAVELAGGALLVAAWLFLFRALADNTFASPLVRIQDEREQRVTSTGVYAVVRHPMYLGAVLMFVGAPLLTGAASALVVALLLVIVLVVRIRDEEKLLVDKLAGYEEYRRRVRYRLVPFVW
ncbi:MAG TPA: methyltransferase [Polyangia bacterium]